MRVLTRDGVGRPFALSLFPRVGRQAAAADRSLGRVRAWPVAFRARAGALGEVSLERIGFGGARVFSPGLWEVFGVAAGGSDGGLLAVEGTLAWRLVDGALGLRAPRIPSPLRATERGLLAAQLLLLSRQLGLTLGVDDIDDTQPALGVVRYAMVSGPERLGEIAVAWTASAAMPMGKPPSCAAVPFAVVLQVGTTTLTRDEIARAGAGDVVVADGVAYQRGESALQIGVRVGGWALEARLDSLGRLTPANERAAWQTLHDRASDERSPMATSDRDDTGFLATVPVEVAIEIGHLTLTGAELAGLAEGHVLETGLRPGDDVLVRVSGRAWARGELIDVEGTLGVRLRQLL